jgi:hypothetical protein
MTRATVRRPMKTVFLLEHLHILPDESEDIKTIGIYCSKQDAIAAIERLKSQPGFSKYPNLIDPVAQDYVSGFYLQEYELGKDQWIDGFVTV